MNERILVVDDEESLRLTMKLKLKAAGFDVDVAEDGEAAIEKLKLQEFDAVLLDINMPRMSGIEALGIIRQQFPKTEAIMLTGFADFTTAIECLKNGARDYLVKPIDTTELITRLQSLLRSKSSEQALFDVQRQYTSIFADELLEPLKKVQSALEKAAKLKEKSESAERETLINETREKCSVMEKVVQTLLDFSRKEFEGKKTDESNAADLSKRIAAIKGSRK
jgi:DNA-binding response OmpR family regulator